MASLNPFLEDDSLFPSNRDAIEITSTSQVPLKGDLSVDYIAEELLKKRFILTALELYTEIQERGKDLARLRNYFSNPLNFEQQSLSKETSGSTNPLYRTASSSTFDSLDITRYSDDGGQHVDERIAVLEFELRKAKDTIKSLREDLTKTAELDASCLNETSNLNIKISDTGAEVFENLANDIKPLEMRAINHLVNEYLLNHGYKLSSITFADENDEQDFEDWHDVGINTPKPPELLKLYRDYNNHVTPKVSTCDVSITTDDFTSIDQSHNDENTMLIEELKNEISCLKKESDELNKRILDKERESEQSSIKLNESIYEVHTCTERCENLNENPTQFETKRCENFAEDNTAKLITSVDESGVDARDEVRKSQSYQPDPSRMSGALWEFLLSKTQSTVEESWLKSEVVNICQSPNELVSLLSRCLPHIVPTVLLAKRDQLIPLLLSSAALHEDLQVRNDLLHILFNLIKKPIDEQRQTILHGCMAYAKHVGCDRSEEELLPQFWEQIGHKFSERRQLVAEACGVIAPHLRAEMRGSLLVSILHQMEQEEKTEEVRCSIVRSLALIYAFLEDEDKYKQAFGILPSFLKDKSALVCEATYHTLLPSIAVWSMHRKVLSSHVADSLLEKLEEAVKEQTEEQSCLAEISPLTHILPFLFVAVILETSSDIPKEGEYKECRIIENMDDLYDPSVIIGDEALFSQLLFNFDANVAISGIDAKQGDLLWITHQLVPRLLKLLKEMSPLFEEAVSRVCNFFQVFQNLFGKSYMESKINPQFVNILKNSDVMLSTSVLPVYVVAILSKTEESGREDLNHYLFTSTVKLSLSKLPSKSIRTTLSLLRSNVKHHDTIVQFLWSTVIHDSPLVRATAASLFVVMTTSDVDLKVLSTRILPALITLSTDDDINVKISTIQSLYSVVTNSDVTVEIVERVIAQLTEIVSSSVDASLEEHSLDSTLLGLHSLQLLIINLSIKVGPTVHPKFRDEFIIPYLLVIAASNNQASDTSKRSITALALLEAYSCLSCCFINTSLLQGSILPALKCLREDIEALHPDHENNLTSLITEAEQKLDRGSVTSDSSPHRLSFPAGMLGQAVSVGADDAKKKIRNTWDQLRSRAPANPTVFQWKKS